MNDVQNSIAHLGSMRRLQNENHDDQLQLLDVHDTYSSRHWGRSGLACASEMQRELNSGLPQCFEAFWIHESAGEGTVSSVHALPAFIFPL